MKNCTFTATAISKTISVKYTIDICAVHPSQCLLFEHRNHFAYLCKTGCKNYNMKWSCPPLAPAFSSLALRWSNLYILYMRIPLDAFSSIKNDYLKIKAANSMLKSRADRYMQTLAGKYGKYISTGSCRLCKPCKLQEGKPCAHSQKMAYSFEALGIDVGALVNQYFDFPLLWYKKGALPEYSAVVCGLLTDENLSFELLRQEYTTIVKN